MRSLASSASVCVNMVEIIMFHATEQQNGEWTAIQRRAARQPLVIAHRSSVLSGQVGGGSHTGSSTSVQVKSSRASSTLGQELGASRARSRKSGQRSKK
ncbi:hypothetical protein VDGL01_04746 [Verticillium dahliae]